MANHGDAALRRYDLFGWDYEAINPLSEAEVRWHVQWAGSAGGPILALACGGGRLLSRLALAGYDVTGVDLSETMLGLARANVRSLTEEARKRVHLVKADMARFRFKRQFGLAIIADNSFRELKTRRQLRQCLRSIRRHLRPEGKLLITERRFRPELYPNGVRSFGWSELKPHPNSRDLVRRRGFIRLHRNGKRVSGVFIYEVIHPDETTTTVRCPILAPVLDLREYLALFSETGYRTEAFHDYEMKPATGDGTMLCFVCSPAKHAN